MTSLILFHVCVKNEKLATDMDGLRGSGAGVRGALERAQEDFSGDPSPVSPLPRSSWRRPFCRRGHGPALSLHHRSVIFVSAFFVWGKQCWKERTVCDLEPVSWICARGCRRGLLSAGED